MHSNAMHYAYMDTPAERLEAARRRKGIETAVEAADQLGIRRTTYQNYEDGSRGFARHIPRLAQFYGVRQEWLATGRLPMVDDELQRKFRALNSTDQEKVYEYMDMLAAKSARR